jgi:hypothetical protein
VFAVLAVLASFAMVVAFSAPAFAVHDSPTDDVIGPVPTPDNPPTITFHTPTDGLTDGQAVNFQVKSTGTDTINTVDVKICAHGSTTYSTSTFGYSPPSGTRCVRQGGITSGNLGLITPGTNPAAAGYYRTGVYNYNGATDTDNISNSLINPNPPLSFTAGRGTVSWDTTTVGVHGNGGNPLTCDVTHKCDLVTYVGLSGDSVADTFFIQPLTYFGAPAAPLGVNVPSPASGALDVTWSQLGNGIPSGNGTVDSYTVALTKQGGDADCVSSNPAPQVINAGFTGVDHPVTTTVAHFTGLDNFCTYNASVIAEAVASDGTTHTSGIAGTGSGTPLQGAPALSGVSGNSQASLTWTDQGADSYDLYVTGGSVATAGCTIGTWVAAAPAHCHITGSPAAHSTTVTGLTNGSTYNFSVTATFGGNTTGASNTVSLQPGTLVQQTINVIRPQGTLVVSQYCAGNPQDINGQFDPSNNNGNDVANNVPVTVCSFSLSGPRPDRLLGDAITADPRTVTDAVTSGTSVQSDTANFAPNDIGQIVQGDGIHPGSRIASVTDATHATLDHAVDVAFSGGGFQVLGTTVNFGQIAGQTITPDNGTGLTASDNAMEIEGDHIPGGTTIAPSGVISASRIDLSAPADSKSNGFSVREWTHAPTPAHLITSGPMQGQYFQATGLMRQVVLVDTRSDVDQGWSVTGQVSDFSDGGHSFSGNDLGWKPKGDANRHPLHGYSQPILGSPDGSYTMNPTTGLLVAPGTTGTGGLGLSGTTGNHDASQGASTIPGQTLAFADAHGGLGLARLDADLTLLIPVQDQPGHYSATLTITAI